MNLFKLDAYVRKSTRASCVPLRVSSAQVLALLARLLTR